MDAEQIATIGNSHRLLARRADLVQVPDYRPGTVDGVARLRETLLMDPLKLRRELLQPDAPSESGSSATPLAQRSPDPR